jgi:integrase
MFPDESRRKRSPKSAHSWRAVPIADRVAGELDRHFKAASFQADDDLVFAHPHTVSALDRHEVSRRFNNTLKLAGVREVRFHDLRHTFGTRMAAAGVPIRTLQEWMGHADIKTTLVYAHYVPSPNEASMVNAAFSVARSTADFEPDDKLSKSVRLGARRSC